MTHSDTTPSQAQDHLRKQVRTRYAQAANSIATGITNAELNTELQVLDNESAASCCSDLEPVGTNAPLDDAFGAGLYSPEETNQVPPKPSRPASDAATRRPSQPSTPANACWIWVREAASTCCFLRAGLAKPVSPMALT